MLLCRGHPTGVQAEIEFDGPSVYCASQGVGHFAWALGVAFEAKLLKAVFPLLAAAASRHSSVSDAAMATLERVCCVCIPLSQVCLCATSSCFFVVHSVDV